MTYFPFGTLMRLLQRSREGSHIAQICLVCFLVGLFLVIVAASRGSGVGVLIGGILFVLSIFGSGPRGRQL
jgi:hypothetical protein